MAKFYDEMNEDHIRFIAEQKIFFTATAAPTGHINLSPKGMDTLRCFDAHTVAYLDLTGSGNESAAHFLQDGRMTMMWCSFTSKPLILRLYGRGEAVQLDSPRGGELSAHFPTLDGQRQIIMLHVESVQTSCGYAVPFYEFQSERESLVKWAAHKGEDGMEEYRREKNLVSMDGFPTGLSI